MKLYTKTGDGGSTSLAGGTGGTGGKRVDKDALRIECYGSVDELNSFIGLAICACSNDELTNMLTLVQQQLFEIGAELASSDTAMRITSDHVAQLEKQIDCLCQPLEEMRSFILPGGCELAARLHVARCVCRRVERMCVTLKKKESVNEQIIRYINRLSDMLFAMARRANQLAGVADVPWSDPAK